MKLLQIILPTVIALSLLGCGSSTMTSSDSDDPYAAEIQWAIPKIRENGDKLPEKDVKIVKIYHGQQTDSLNVIAETSDVFEGQYAVKDLWSGDHYFALTVVDQNKLESDFSEIMMITIP